jgi:hypothetical protein
MYQDHSALQAAGQLLWAFAFLATGVRNAGWKFHQHLERMAAYGVPQPRAVGAALLIAFTALASAIFHRWWLMPDPLLRHLHLSSLIVNGGIIGGLLLVAAIP